MRTTTKFSLLAVTCAAALALTGCAGSKDAASPTVTDTVTTAPQPTTSETPSSSPSSTPSTPSTGGGSGTVTACTTAGLSGSIQPGSGGAAGSVYVSLVLKNTGTSPCTIQGWPGVSFVGGGDGQQIGQAASFDRSTSHATLTLAAGQAATSDLRIVQAGNYDAGKCNPKTAEGFRVYPPGQKASLFVKDAGVMACGSVSVPLLTVSGLHS